MLSTNDSEILGKLSHEVSKATVQCGRYGLGPTPKLALLTALRTAISRLENHPQSMSRYAPDESENARGLAFMKASFGIAAEPEFADTKSAMDYMVAGAKGGAR